MLVVRFFRYVHKKVHMLLLFRVIVYSCKKDVRKLDCQKLDVTKIKKNMYECVHTSLIYLKIMRTYYLPKLYIFNRNASNIIGY